MLICLVLPDFVIHLEQSKLEMPTLVYETKGKKSSVYALSEVARRLGITRGMSKSRSRALCREVEEKQVNPKRYARLAQDVIMTLLPYSDRIEWEQTDSLTIWLDMGKASSGEIRTTVEALKNQIGEPYQVGVASGRLLARIAALTAPRNSPRRVMPGQEKALLSPLRLEQFATTKRFREQCEQLGIYTLADLAHLPYPAVVKRFGDSGGQLHRLYHGHDRQTLNRYSVPLQEQASHAFDTPIIDRCIVERVLHQMSCHLAQKLLVQGLACGDITLIVQDENRLALEASRTLREAVQSQKAIDLELIRLLDQLDMTSGIESLTVVIERLAPPVPQQMDFFGELFGKPEPSLQEVAERLIPRHQETPLYRVIVSTTPPYLPERKIAYASVTAA